MATIAVVVILIPATYSVLPLIEDYRIRKNKSKNCLSHNTFTDRENDLNNIIEKLLTHEHVIEITGNGKQCGKTWIAKKIVDYINHPNHYKKIKKSIPYKAAYYIDMKDVNTDYIDNLLENNIINSKTVLIFDHVCDLDYILTKQSLYHFQLIYIFEKNCDFNFFKYNISTFQEENIDELHEKIRSNYSEIDRITKSEIQTLYELTEGNIGKIHLMLSSQKCVVWIKEIAAGKPTNYELILNKIKIELLIGNYRKADEMLDQLKQENEESLYANNSFFYKYNLLKADCEHLLNNYSSALSVLAVIEQEPYCKNNKNYELELSKAHYNKHLWKCNEALEILYQIKQQSYAAKVDSLGIFLAKYFINDIYVPYSESNTLDIFLDTYYDASSNIHGQESPNALKCRRYEAAYMYYKNHPTVCDSLIDIITTVINTYKAQNDRLSANAYFMRGEIYRMYEQYDKAIQDYEKTISITVDNNIRTQTNLIVIYLSKCKKIKIESDLLTGSMADSLYDDNYYSQIVYRKINSIILDDPNKAAIINMFDTRIMPIL
ncbi:MAG: tetratricopeptide repeat protein [Muribaculum sp.]|nr:tetratricopeptide repeat protein [Muribaculum sp.]